jgi:hypothetical protein
VHLRLNEAHKPDSWPGGEMSSTPAIRECERKSIGVLGNLIVPRLDAQRGARVNARRNNYVALRYQKRAVARDPDISNLLLPVCFASRAGGQGLLRTFGFCDCPLDWPLTRSGSHRNVIRAKDALSDANYGQVWLRKR